MEPIERKEDGRGGRRGDEANRYAAGMEICQNSYEARLCLEREVAVDAGIVASLCKELLRRNCEAIFLKSAGIDSSPVVPTSDCISSLVGLMP